LTAVAVVVCAMVVVGFAAQQDSLAVGWAQFRANMLVRGQELNQLPEFNNLYNWVFTGLGLGILTLLPAGIGLIPRFRAWPGAAAYLGGFAVWMILGRGQFIAWGHFCYLAQPILHAQLIGSPRTWFRRTAWIIGGVFSFLHLYHGKAQFWPGPRPVSASYAAARSVATQPGEFMAADFFAYGSMTDHESLLHYEMIRGNYWPRFLASTPPAIRARLPHGEQTIPPSPQRIVITAYSLDRFGPPDAVRYRQVRGPSQSPMLEIGGRRLSLLRDPLAICVFERRDDAGR